MFNYPYAEDNFNNSVFRNFDNLFNSLIYNFPKDIKPPVSWKILESDSSSPKKIVMQVALAGFDDKSISVYYESDKLCISGDNLEDKTIHEKFRSKFSWEIPVSKKLDLNKTEITFKNGLLIIEIPIIVPERTRIYLKGGENKELPSSS